MNFGSENLSIEYCKDLQLLISIEVIDSFYILSTGRTGTTTLSRVLQQKRNIHQTPNSGLLNVLSNAALNKNICKKILLEKFFNLEETPPSTADPLKTMGLVLYLNDLIRNNPEKIKNVVIIHIIRDPRDFVTSFMNWKNRKLSGIIAHHLTPYWMPKPKVTGIKSLWKTISMSKFEHFCWIWNFKNKLIYDSFSDLPNYHLLKFEDVIEDPDTIKTIQGIISGDRTKTDPKIQSSVLEKRNESIKKSFPNWKEWDPKKAKILEEHCGVMMKMFSYGAEVEWRDKLNS